MMGPRSYPWLSLTIVLIILLVSSSLFARERLILGTTTSTDNSGLLQVLIPPFEEKYGINVDVIAVGTGRAMELGRNGDVDVILVHDPQSEEAFIQQGYGVDRRAVMYNDYVILGPDHDPASISKADSVVEAFRLIFEGSIPFISRGDNSGTHKKELEIWQELGITPQGSWYRLVGQGMGSSINIADEHLGYILADRGTYLAYSDKTDLVILYENDPLLFNPYAVLGVNPEVHPHVNIQGAKNFIEYLSDQGQDIIQGYRIDDQALFFTFK